MGSGFSLTSRSQSHSISHSHSRIPPHTPLTLTHTTAPNPAPAPAHPPTPAAARKPATTATATATATGNNLVPIPIFIPAAAAAVNHPSASAARPRSSASESDSDSPAVADSKFLIKNNHNHNNNNDNSDNIISSPSNLPPAAVSVPASASSPSSTGSCPASSTPTAAVMSHLPAIAELSRPAALAASPLSPSAVPLVVGGPPVSRSKLSHRNSLVHSIDIERRHKHDQEMFLNQNRLLNSQIPANQAVIYLPRGGLYIQTPAGPIQFGLPPETIKDSMKLGLTLPVNFIIPKERFNLQMGINVAEFEFPSYYNFFFKRRRVNLITTREVEPLIRTIFQQTLLGPKEIPVPEEFGPGCPADCYPDLVKEMSFFGVNPFDKTPLTVDSLIEFSYFNSDGICRLPSGVEIADLGDELTVSYSDPAVSSSPLVEVARFSSEVLLGHPTDDNSTTPVGEEKYFVPPHFGVTMLGNSDGFDQNGTTTGFVLWMNRRGIMVDPPPHSSKLLKRHGISPRLIKAVILSHNHADHDCGLFQKILEEGKVLVLTSEIVMNSFLKKYTAVSGLEESFLRKLFVLRPVQIGERIPVYGGHLEFFYSLHSIPCVGFSAYCNGRSMIYSADTFNDRAGIDKLFDMGLISAGRRDRLQNFPWHHDLILHEAGVPPIHTPMSTFEPLSDEIKQKIYIVHKPSKDVPAPLKSARVGPENTLIISAEQAPNAIALEILDLVGSIEMFSSFVVSKALEIVQYANVMKFSKGETLIEEGSYGSSLYIIAMGIVSITQGDHFLKQLTVGDHFGEQAFLSDEKGKRTATIRADTPVEVFQFSKMDFMHIVRNSNAIERLKQLGNMQRTESWQVISANSILNPMTSAQKTYLQSILQRREVKVGESVWQLGDEAVEAIIVAEGKFCFDRAEDLPFSRGAFIGDMRAIINGTPLTTTLSCTECGSVYFITKADLIKFFDENPGVKVVFLNRKFIE